MLEKAGGVVLQAHCVDLEFVIVMLYQCSWYRMRPYLDCSVYRERWRSPQMICVLIEDFQSRNGGGRGVSTASMLVHAVLVILEREKDRQGKDRMS